MDAELRNLADVYVREMQRLKNYLEEGETIESGTVMPLILCVVSIMYESFRNMTIRFGL